MLDCSSCGCRAIVGVRCGECVANLDSFYQLQIRELTHRLETANDERDACTRAQLRERERADEYLRQLRTIHEQRTMKLLARISPPTSERGQPSSPVPSKRMKIERTTDSDVELRALVTNISTRPKPASEDDSRNKLTAATTPADDSTIAPARPPASELRAYEARIVADPATLRYECPLCTREASASRYTIVRHMRRIHFGIHAHKCNYCDYGCDKIDRMISHTRREHGDAGDDVGQNISATSTIDESFEEDVPKPQVVAQPTTPTANNEVGQDVSEEDQLEQAMSSSERSADGRLVCPKCDSTWLDRSRLRRHIREKHFGIRPYRCGECLFGSSKKTLLEAHIAKVHADDTTNVASPASVGDVISLNDGDDE